jgi:hypothetical protein
MHAWCFRLGIPRINCKCNKNKGKGSTFWCGPDGMKKIEDSCRNQWAC